MKPLAADRRQDVGQNRKVHHGPGFATVSVRRNAGQRTASMSRCLDLAIGVPLLLALAPLLGVIALAIAMERRGPVLCRHERLGFRGRRFLLWKFNTWESGRMTQVGRVLRATHLDDVPLLLNVLLGEMSLVGPRADRPFIAVLLDREIPEYWHRFDVLPGLTGLAQIRAGRETSIDSIRTTLRYDLFYIRRRSASLYLFVLSGAVGAAVRAFMGGESMRRGAEEAWEPTTPAS